MEFYKAKNERDRAKVIEAIKMARVPFKIAYQDGYPARSLDQNAYYWLLVGMVSDHTGHSNQEVHDAFRKMFLVGYHHGTGGWRTRVKSTTELDTVEFANYIERIKAEAATELGLCLPEPWEVISGE